VQGGSAEAFIANAAEKRNPRTRAGFFLCGEPVAIPGLRDGSLPYVVENRDQRIHLLRGVNGRLDAQRAPVSVARMHWFLQKLVPFHQAGFVQLMAACVTFAALLLALWPHWDKWRKRARFRIEIIKGDTGREREMIPGHFGSSMGSQASAGPPIFTERAYKITLRNYGKSAASNVKLVATQLYAWNGQECIALPFDEFSFGNRNKDEALAAGLTTQFLICGCSRTATRNSGFRLGCTPGTRQGFNTGADLEFDESGFHFPSGESIVRLVAFADGVSPSTHFIVVNTEVPAVLRIATKEEKKAVKKADARTADLEITVG